jgi:6-phosphofructokinase 1
VLRAAAVRTLRTYEGHLVGFVDGWKGVFENRTRELDRAAIRGILPRGGTILGTSRIDPVREGGIERVRDALNVHDIDGLIVVGGEGTLSAARALSEGGIPIVGVPKTIDNDVPGTDFAVGFDTALGTVVEAVDRLHTTAESHDRVIVLETMGRSVGWLAVCAGLAGGADTTVAPESPMSVHAVCETVRHRLARGREFSVVVVAEGSVFASDPDGWSPPAVDRRDPFGRPVYGGIGEVLAAEIERRLKVEARTVKLGYVQRGGAPSAFDRLLATRMGIHAVDLAAERRYGRMVSLTGLTIGSVGLDVLGQGPRPVHPELCEVARVFFG